MMFQSYALFPHMTVLDNVAYNLRMRGIGKAARREQAQAMLARVHLEAFADRMPAQLSGGQQQRVALARALITNPRVLLLDEPLSALDEYLRLQMRGELKRLQRELGITFIHVTHTQLEAIALADLVVVMDQGRIEQAGSAQEIYSEPRTAYVARFMGGQNVLSGKVTTVADGEAILLERAGRPFRAAGRATRRDLAGTPVHCAVRRDRIQLEPLPGPGRSGQINALTGQVHAIEYQGSYVKVTLDVPGWPDFVADRRRRPLLRGPGRHRRCRARALVGQATPACSRATSAAPPKPPARSASTTRNSASPRPDPRPDRPTRSPGHLVGRRSPSLT